MSVEYLKRASKSAASDEQDVREVVARMLREIKLGGEATAIEYGRAHDGWTGDVVVSREAIDAASEKISPRMRGDIRYAYQRVRDFAAAQHASLGEFEIELVPGLFAGQKLIPVSTAGCYVPGGRYSHVASAIMTATTAKVAGVERVIACTPPSRDRGIHPAVLYALDLCGADTILALGGVQGVAALAFGLFTGRPADMLVGPGNQYVAEAKRMLYGQVGIDLFAGPTEILIIADETADASLVAVDVVGQAEHGPNSPAWLVTTSRTLAEAVLRRIPELLENLPEPNRSTAVAAWRDYGEVLLVGTRGEAVATSDGYAPEHLEVHAADPDWWLSKLHNYGSLFLGDNTTVAFGDKASGPNHILPTKGAARYTGGLSVGKFIKTVTYQRMSPEATRDIAAVTARISRLEGMEAHARTADERLRKNFPREQFQTTAQD
jgi:sulfopropanediol 3-dehydrogenase